jgi:hypothetical protein
LVLDVSRQESAAQAKAEELSKELAVSQEAVSNFFRILNKQQVPSDQLAAKLDEIAYEIEHWRDQALDAKSASAG